MRTGQQGSRTMKTVHFSLYFHGLSLLSDTSPEYVLQCEEADPKYVKLSSGCFPCLFQIDHRIHQRQDGTFWGKRLLITISIIEKGQTRFVGLAPVDLTGCLYLGVRRFKIQGIQKQAFLAVQVKCDQNLQNYRKKEHLRRATQLYLPVGVVQKEQLRTEVKLLPQQKTFQSKKLDMIEKQLQLYRQSSLFPFQEGKQSCEIKPLVFQKQLDQLREKMTQAQKDKRQLKEQVRLLQLRNSQFQKQMSAMAQIQAQNCELHQKLLQFESRARELEAKLTTVSQSETSRLQTELLDKSKRVKQLQQVIGRERLRCQLLEQSKGAEDELRQALQKSVLEMTLLKAKCQSLQRAREQSLLRARDQFQKQLKKARDQSLVMAREQLQGTREQLQRAKESLKRAKEQSLQRARQCQQKGLLQSSQSKECSELKESIDCIVKEHNLTCQPEPVSHGMKLRLIAECLRQGGRSRTPDCGECQIEEEMSQCMVAYNSKQEQLLAKELQLLALETRLGKHIQQSKEKEQTLRMMLVQKEHSVQRKRECILRLSRVCSSAMVLLKEQQEARQTLLYELSCQRQASRALLRQSQQRQRHGQAINQINKSAREPEGEGQHLQQCTLISSQLQRGGDSRSLQLQLQTVRNESKVKALRIVQLQQILRFHQSQAESYFQ